MADRTQQHDRKPSAVASPDGPDSATLHSLFEERVRLSPNAVAAWVDGRALTYSELNAEANRLAHYLVERWGVGPEDFVAILVSRSDRMLIAILAVLKAGGAYVPIDPHYPDQAIQFMLRDAAAKVHLVDTEYLHKLGGYCGAAVILDLELGELGTPDSDPESPATNVHLAYAIYTSGSTGLRKAVAVEHRAAVNTILWRQSFYGFSTSTVAIQIPSFALDSSIADIFSVLVSGGALLILGDETRTDVHYIRQLAIERGANYVMATPTFYSLLLPALQGSEIRCVTVAGEAIPIGLVKKHFEILPDVRLVNEYGPTENAVCSTATDLRPVDKQVSIGIALPNVEVLVLDSDMRATLDGVEGEIYLGGAGLARGYVHRPDLTAERFVPHPFGSALGARLYRTGDRAVRLPNGDLEYLGRLDHQVKLRGFRVELSEIQAVLEEHPSVRQATVVCIGDSDQDKRLVAYVVERQPGSAVGLRDYLVNLLPDHMVPAVIMAIDALPMNANGKLDRSLLPDPLTAAVPDRDDLVPPRNLVEKELRNMWTEILQVADVSVHDNFFDIGGNSLRAAQLQAEISSRLGTEISFHSLYENSTIAGIARKIGQHAAGLKTLGN